MAKMKFNAPFEPEPPVKFAPVPPEFVEACEWLIRSAVLGHKQTMEWYSEFLKRRTDTALRDKIVKDLNEVYENHMQTAARLLRWLEANQKKP